MSASQRTVRVDSQAGPIEIAYLEQGEGRPVILLHGFPYDAHAYDEAAADLAGRGCRVLVPWLRGFSPTRLLDPARRLGQQAALGADLLAFMDALGIERATLAGYDWGGRAACIVAALWPQRVSGLVTGEGYAIQDIAGAGTPAAPEMELRYWYQYYFHTPRGEAGLEAGRDALCRLLWRLWSPTWDFAEETFARSAAAFAGPDFVPVTIHSYRHRYGYAPGDPALAGIEARLAKAPPIGVPTIAVFGRDDGVAVLGRDPAADRAHFTGSYRRLEVPGAGHNFPQERPAVLVQAVMELPATA